MNEPESFSPSPSSSNSINREQLSPLLFQQDGVVLCAKEALAIRILDDEGIVDTVKVENDSDEESLKTPNVELELIMNENHHDYLKMGDNHNQGHLSKLSCESKLKAGRELDAAAGDTEKIDKLLTKVERIFYGNSRPVGADSHLTLDEAIHLLDLFVDRDEEDEIYSQCEPMTLDLVFKGQDCNESNTSEITFTSDATEEVDCVFSFLGCGSIIADHIIDSLDLFCY
eukprot:CAMPEP_0172539598 /NCGR_PEP_ID=MMETSP1067-20121228/10775_1 /TAXON_ID=265564 ORGANISM="Thalassiosira punctigera, Strain Tpunct2005C2" /NCGR_SAMPLE_ID=MMETSP1067 /ASSEMBLY_ACC=CAM_ASM_000444 /LENGTH=227 /DNA_ID=CAMNT_0013325309 /DNA_START=1 /DNA_END=684 /DNA_ORIENTATION=-